MTDRELVVTVLGVNWQSVIEYIQSEVLRLEVGDLVKLLAVFKHPDIERGAGVISWTDYHLLFEDDSVLGGHVRVSVLDWLALDNLLESEAVFVAEGIDHQLAFIGVVRHDSLDDEEVASTAIRFESKIREVHLIQHVDLFCLSGVARASRGTPVHNSYPHVIKKVLVCCSIYLDVNDRVLLFIIFLFRDLELILTE